MDGEIVKTVPTNTGFSIRIKDIIN